MFNSKESITKHDINKTSTKLTDVNLTISIITLNIKGPNHPIKKRLPDWIMKQDPTIYYVKEAHFKQRHRQDERIWMRKDKPSKQ